MLKYAGAFPYKFVYKTKQKEHLRQIEIDTSWKSFINQGLLAIYLLLRTAFGCTRLGQHAIENGIQASLNPICVSILFFSAITITIVSNRHKKEIVELLNGCHESETEIQRLQLSTSPKRSSYGGDGRWSQKPYSTVRNNLACILIANVVTVMMSATARPGYVMFLSSLAAPSAEVTWLKVISTLEVGINFALIFIQFAQFDFLGTLLALFIRNSLRNLRPNLPRKDKVDPQSQNKLQDPAEIWRLYTNLNQFVVQFNSVYGTLLLALKFNYMICLCTLFYIPLRYGFPVNVLTVSVFVSLVATILRKVTQMLMAMGAVRKAAAELKELWVCALDHPNSNIGNDVWRETYHFSNTIAFRAGNLYDIDPSTILTFFSTATTYIIVVLTI